MSIILYMHLRVRMRLAVRLVTVVTELNELEELMKKYVLRRTKSLIASQLPRKGTYMYMYIIHAQ